MTLTEVSRRGARWRRHRPTITRMPYCLLLRFDSAGPCCVLLRDDVQLDGRDGVRYRMIAATETWAEADAIRASIEQRIKGAREFLDYAMTSEISSVVSVSR